MPAVWVCHVSGIDPSSGYWMLFLARRMTPVKSSISHYPGPMHKNSECTTVQPSLKAVSTFIPIIGQSPFVFLQQPWESGLVSSGWNSFWNTGLPQLFWANYPCVRCRSCGTAFLPPLPASSPVLGWIVSPQIHVHPETVNVTLFENRVFADVIKLRRGHTGLACVLNAIWLMSL